MKACLEPTWKKFNQWKWRFGKFWECKEIWQYIFVSKKKLFAEIEGLFAHMFCKECLKNLCDKFGNKKCQPKILFANIYALLHVYFGKIKYGKGDGSKRRRTWVLWMKCCDRRWKKSAKPAMSRELWEPFCFRFLVCEFPSISCPMLRENPPPRTDFQCSSQSEIGQQLFLTSSVWPYFS